MVSVEIPFTGTVPTGVAVGLGIEAWMITTRKTAGTTIASRFASGIGGGWDGHTVTGDGEPIHIPEQTELP